MDDVAAELLFRNSIEITLIVDADTARDLDDDALDRVLGKYARRLIREELEWIEGEGREA